MQAEIEEAFPLIRETDIDPYDTVIAGLFLFLEGITEEERKRIKDGIGQGIRSFISTLEKNNVDFIHTLSPDRIYITDPTAIIKKDNSVYRLFREEMDSIQKQEAQELDGDLPEDEESSRKLGTIGVSTKKIPAHSEDSPEKESGESDESDESDEGDGDDDSDDSGAFLPGLDINSEQATEEAVVNSVFGDMLEGSGEEMGTSVLDIDVEDEDSSIKEDDEDDEDDVPMMGDEMSVHIDSIGGV